MMNKPDWFSNRSPKKCREERLFRGHLYGKNNRDEVNREKGILINGGSEMGYYNFDGI